MMQLLAPNTAPWIIQDKYAYVRIYSKALSEDEIKQQMAADLGEGAYAVQENDESVVMWLDYSKA